MTKIFFTNYKLKAAALIICRKRKKYSRLPAGKHKGNTYMMKLPSTDLTQNDAAKHFGAEFTNQDVKN